MNLKSVPIKTATTEDRLNRQTILEQAATYHHSQNCAEVESANNLDRHLSTKTSQVLTNVIGSHQILLHQCANALDYSFEIQHLSTGNFHLVPLQWQGAFKLTQSTLKDRYLIYVVLAGSLNQKIDAQRLAPIECYVEETSEFAYGNKTRSDTLIQQQQLRCAPDTATIISPGQKLESISSAQGEVLLVSIDRNSIDSALGKLLDRPLKQPLIFRAQIDLTSDLGVSLKKFLHFLWDGVAGAGTVSSSFVLKELEQAFLACIIKGLSSNYSEELQYQHEGAFAAHVRKARAFIESNLHEDIKVGDIATAVGVCARLLQKAFSHQCGCSPMRFVTQERLQRIRQELDRSTADTKIVDVMMDYGFTQGGKFAKEYQQLFGEKPSETLKRSSQFNQQQSSLWQQIDDAHSERVVGGRSILSTHTVFSADECLPSQQIWKLISFGGL
jgi:AraC-like DNA-binding protein